MNVIEKINLKVALSIIERGGPNNAEERKILHEAAKTLEKASKSYKK